MNYGKWNQLDEDEAKDSCSGLHLNFEYPAGVRDPVEVSFDIRPEACSNYGGALHGDIVLDVDGKVATVIGVRPNPKTQIPQLWFHCEGMEGAGLFPSQALRLVSKADAVMEHGHPDFKAPSQTCEWLQPTFGYVRGINDKPEWARFDIRDEICERVGTFHHGEVVEAPSGLRFVTIGVLQDPNQDAVGLYLERIGGDFACVMGNEQIQRLKSVGKQKIHEIPESEATIRAASDLCPPKAKTLSVNRSSLFSQSAFVLVLAVYMYYVYSHFFA